jgi:DUF4097 and DUF4098 domain-containing protein YvlB
MDKSLKGIAIVAAAMVTVGALLAGLGFITGGMQPVYFDRDGIHVGNAGDGKHGGRLESFSQEVGSFGSIDVDLDYYDVDLIPADKFAVEGTFFSEEGKPDVKVENGKLTVKDTNHKIVNVDIDLPGLFTTKNNQPAVRIYYPDKTKLKDLSIKCDASDLDYKNLTAEKAEFVLDFGKLELSDISAKSVIVTMSSGDCSLKKITADDLTVSNDMGKTTLDGADLKTLKVDANSGEVTLTGVSADYGDVYADMGKVSGRDLATNGMKVNSSSGDVNLQGKLLGLTDITCDMGAVTVEPGAPKDQFNYELNADMGSVSVGGDNVQGSVTFNGSAKNTLKIKTDMGSIKVNFN